MNVVFEFITNRVINAPISEKTIANKNGPIEIDPCSILLYVVYTEKMIALSETCLCFRVPYLFVIVFIMLLCTTSQNNYCPPNNIAFNVL